MKFSFLGYSVQGIMEFNLDLKDVAILRYFDDFKKSGKMNCEVVDGEEYYWISYQNIERDLPFLNLSKKSIMIRMHKLRDAGLLKHYTKKQGGTFSYYTFGKNYEKLIYLKDNNKDKENKEEVEDNNGEIEKDKDNKDKENKNLDNKEEVEKVENDKVDMSSEVDSKDEIFSLESKSNEKVKKELAFEIDSESEILDSMDEFMNRGNPNKVEGLSLNKNRGCLEKGRTKINLLNNSSTKESNLLKHISREVIDYLNLKARVIYKSSNSKTLSLIRERLREGFTLENFKTVIDKKVEGWKGTRFEEYLTPFTLFGDKFEVYLNQKIRREDNFKELGNFEREPRKLRFDNFESREYDYDILEKKLLGWE